MKLFCSDKYGARKEHRDRSASRSEIEEAFTHQRDYLCWIALLVTGSEVAAEQSVVDATSLSEKATGVFRDWLIRWAQSATARSSVQAVRDLASASAPLYADSSCAHLDHELLSADQVASLREIDPQQVIAALDPLARCVLVLRGIQHASISDCALQLNVSRRSIVAAYCRALQWNDEQELPYGIPVTGTTGSSWRNSL